MITFFNIRGDRWSTSTSRNKHVCFEDVFAEIDAPPARPRIEASTPTASTSSCADGRRSRRRTDLIKGIKRMGVDMV